MTDRRYCPQTGQFEDHDAQNCCSEPIMHIRPVEDIMDAYRRMAQIQAAHLITANDWSSAMELLELAESVISTADFSEDPTRRARRERFTNRLRAYYETHA